MTAIPIVMLTADAQVDRRILQEANTLRAAGFKVTILAMPAGADDQSETDLVNNVLRVDLSVVAGPISKDFWMHRINRRLKKLLNTDNWLYLSIRRSALRFVRDTTPFYQRAFLSLLENLPAQVYVAHDLPMLPVARAALAQNPARPAQIVYDSHELFCEQEFTRSEKRRWQRMERDNIGAASGVITVNSSIAARLKELYKLADVAVLRNAVPCPDPMPARTRYFNQHFGLAGDARIALYQGGLVPGRNLDQLILAWSYLRDTGWHLVLMGNGPELDHLQTLIDKQDLSHCVHLHAAVPQEVLLAHTAAADLGIIPYQATCLNNYYCTPNKLFEFIMAGLPILAQDLPEIAAIITANAIGKVGNLKNASLLARAVRNIISAPEQLNRYAENTRGCRLKINWQEESRFLPDYMARIAA